MHHSGDHNHQESPSFHYSCWPYCHCLLGTMNHRQPTASSAQIVGILATQLAQGTGVVGALTTGAITYCWYSWPGYLGCICKYFVNIYIAYVSYTLIVYVLCFYIHIHISSDIIHTVGTAPMTLTTLIVPPFHPTHWLPT